MGVVIIHILEFAAAAGLIGAVLSLGAPSDHKQPFRW